MNRAIKLILKNWLLQKRGFLQHIVYTSILLRSKVSVLSGPFKGMLYVENSKGGAYLPKLLGIYERELSPKIMQWKDLAFDKVLNVGAGEGYFTVGFALLTKCKNIVAYEPTLYACYLMEKLSELNGVTNSIRIEARLCEVKHMNEELSGTKKPLVFMDVEGAELELLNPDLVPGLLNAYIMVEIHDTVSPVLGSTIIDRFKDSHVFTEIIQEDRSIKDVPYNSIWTSVLKGQFEKAIHEGRGSKMRWFAFEPK